MTAKMAIEVIDEKISWARNQRSSARQDLDQMAYKHYEGMIEGLQFCRQVLTEERLPVETRLV